MLKRIPFLILKLTIFWLFYFALARVFFFLMAFPHWKDMDWYAIMLSGLKADSFVLLLLGIPSVLLLVFHVWKSKKWISSVHQWYHILLIVIFSFTIILDPFWYQMWEKRITLEQIVDVDILRIALVNYNGLLLFGVFLVYLLYVMVMLFLFMNFVWMSHEWIYPRVRVQWLTTIILLGLVLLLYQANQDQVQDLMMERDTEGFIKHLSESLNPLYFWIKN